MTSNISPVQPQKRRRLSRSLFESWVGNPASSKRDVLLEANESRVYALLRAAQAEHSAFEMKQGLHKLDAAADFDQGGFDRIMKAISAIANDGPTSVGYVVIGIADKKADADRIRDLYGTTPVRDVGFWITGIDHELSHHGGTMDGYMSFFSGKVGASGLDPNLMSQVLRDMRPTRYNGRAVLLLTVRPLGEPVSYNDKWYERQGSSTVEVPARDISRLFKRFPSA